MKTLNTTAFLVLFAVILVSCDVEESPPKALGPFSSISCNGGVTFRLVSGATNQVLSTSVGESFYNVSGGVLSLNAPGGSMTIALSELDGFWCNACAVESAGPLTLDTLVMTIHAGSADLSELDITDVFQLTAENLGTYKLSGSSSFFHVITTNAITIKAFDLVTDSTYVNSTTSLGETDVNAKMVFNAFINASGNVYYKGNPPIVRVTAIGLGKAIAK